MIVAKLHLESVIPQAWGGSKAIFRCVYDEALCAEDASFQKATPSGLAEFTIDNPRALQQLVIGETYYFHIDPVRHDQVRHLAPQSQPETKAAASIFPEERAASTLR